MNIYECSLYDRGTFSDTLENREFLFAFDENMARQMFCDHNGYRKNKKGLEIRKIDAVLAKRTYKARIVSHQVYSEDYRCGGYTTCTTKVQGCYCSNCKGETSNSSQLCTNCGAMFV